MFEGLSFIEIVYWASAIVGGLLFIFRTALLFISGDVGDVDADGLDADADLSGGHSDLSFKVLSLQGLTAFFMMFGLSGLAFTSAGWHDLLSALGGVAAGAFSVWVIQRIFRTFTRLQSDGTLRLKNAVGQAGTVYLRIPAGGMGQVSVSIQGGMKVFDARAADGGEIATGKSIKVVNTIGESALIVEEI
jgi:membrane-bound ClpP family serine protease